MTSTKSETGKAKPHFFNKNNENFVKPRDYFYFVMRFEAQIIPILVIFCNCPFFRIMHIFI